MTDIPQNHPRYRSLQLRNRLIDGFRAGLATEAGLLAHGRGEAFDYLLGEKTHEFAEDAIRAASALLVNARHPVFSVNGNAASAAAPEIVELLRRHGHMAAEVNLFHHSPERSRRIRDHLTALGVSGVLDSVLPGAAELRGIQHARRFMHPDGIARADIVLLAIEDGDRCQSLAESGRTVIAIDLNPLSRTAVKAHVSIVDEITRALVVLTRQIEEDQARPREELAARIAAYDDSSVLRRAERVLRSAP